MFLVHNQLAVHHKVIIKEKRRHQGQVQLHLLQGGRPCLGLRSGHRAPKISLARPLHPLADANHLPQAVGGAHRERCGLHR